MSDPTPEEREWFKNHHWSGLYPEEVGAREWFVFVPETVDFGEDAVAALTEDEFLNELADALMAPIDRDAPVYHTTALTFGGPAIRPEDEFSEEI